MVAVVVEEIIVAVGLAPVVAVISEVCVLVSVAIVDFRRPNV